MPCFSRVPIQAANHPDIKLLALRVLIAIGRYADPDGKAYPGLNAISALTKIDKRLLPREIARLVTAGCLRLGDWYVHPNGARTRIYHLLYEAPDAIISPDDDQRDIETTIISPDDAPSSPEMTKQPIEQPIKERPPISPPQGGTGEHHQPGLSIDQVAPAATPAPTLPEQSFAETPPTYPAATAAELSSPIGAPPPPQTSMLGKGRIDAAAIEPTLPLGDVETLRSKPSKSVTAAVRASRTIVDHDFAEFWALRAVDHHHRVDQARRAFRKAAHTTDTRIIIEGWRRYLRSFSPYTTQGQKWAVHPHNWLECGMWDKEPPKHPASVMRMLAALRGEPFLPDQQPSDDFAGTTISGEAISDIEPDHPTTTAVAISLPGAETPRASPPVAAEPVAALGQWFSTVAFQIARIRPLEAAYDDHLKRSSATRSFALYDPAPDIEGEDPNRVRSALSDALLPCTPADLAHIAAMIVTLWPPTTWLPIETTIATVQAGLADLPPDLLVDAIPKLVKDHPRQPPISAIRDAVQHRVTVRRRLIEAIDRRIQQVKDERRSTFARRAAAPNVSAPMAATA